jgi:hypothetical protein
MHHHAEECYDYGRRPTDREQERVGRVTKLRLPYVNEYRDVRGKVRRYFRRRGEKRIPLPGLPGSEQFMAAYQIALAGDESKLEIGASRTKPGTVNAAIVGYYTSTVFQELSAGSKKQYRSILERFRNMHGTSVFICWSNGTSPSCSRNCDRMRAPIGCPRFAGC